MKKIIAFLCLLAFPAIAAPIGNPIISVQSSAAEASRVLKNTQGYLNGFNVTSGAVSGYVLFFDATSAPANGAATPKLCYIVPANSTVGASFISYPVPFVNGIVIEFSTTGCFTATSSATAFFSAQVQ